MNEELCILNLLQVITKLKSAISVLVGDDVQKIHHIEKLFIFKSTLGANEAKNNKMMQFLDKRERLDILKP